MSPDECYLCSAPGIDYVCRECRRFHTPVEIAQKRFIAALLRNPSKGSNE